MAETATADPPAATSSGTDTSSSSQASNAGPEGNGADGPVTGVTPPSVTPPKPAAATIASQPPLATIAEIPRPVRPEFKPDFNPKVTHDLRTYKPEVEHAGILAPRKISDAMGAVETVTIPKDEFDRLAANADIKALLVDFTQSDCTAAEAELLQRLTHQLNGVPTPGAEAAAVVAPVHLDEEPAKKPRTTPGVVLAVVALAVLAFGGIGYYVLAHPGKGASQSPANAQPAKTQAPAPRTFYVALNAPNLAIQQALALAQKNIIWFTSDPMDGHIWDILDTIRHKSGMRVTLMAATDSVTPDELTSIAREHDLTTYQATLSIGHVNWFLVDDHYLLVADGNLIAPFSADPNDTVHAIQLIRAKITPSLRMLYEGRPIATARR
jgi:hypothetical protein